MARKANTSSVDTNDGYKLAAYGNQYKAAMKGAFRSTHTDNSDPVVNARKAANLALDKAKAKKKAKMAKASKKKNKK